VCVNCPSMSHHNCVICLHDQHALQLNEGLFLCPSEGRRPARATFHAVKPSMGHYHLHYIVSLMIKTPLRGAHGTF
jgi:hypothetical protein